MNGMLLEFLQDALRIETRVRIVEAGDEAKRNDVVFAAVDPGAAVFLGGERPAQGVDDFAGSDAARGHFPEFFHADTVGLRVAVSVELEASDKLLGERATRAFGENHDFGVQIVAGLEVGFSLAGLSTPLSSVRTPTTRSSSHQQFGAGEAGEDGDAGFLHFAAQPLHEAVQGDDIVAVIAQRRRRDGQLEFAFLRQEINRFLADLRRRAGLPFQSRAAVRAWSEDRAARRKGSAGRFRGPSPGRRCFLC